LLSHAALDRTAAPLCFSTCSAELQDVRANITVVLDTGKNLADVLKTFFQNLHITSEIISANVYSVE